MHLLQQNFKTVAICATIIVVALLLLVFFDKATLSDIGFFITTVFAVLLGKEAVSANRREHAATKTADFYREELNNFKNEINKK